MTAAATESTKTIIDSKLEKMTVLRLRVCSISHRSRLERPSMQLLNLIISHLIYVSIGLVVFIMPRNKKQVAFAM